jgi:chemotaxis protein MotA
MDIATLLGLVIGLTAILVGQVLEGGHISQIVQPTAALIVLGGTLGATLVSFPTQDIVHALRAFPQLFGDVTSDFRRLIHEIVEIAAIARKEGVLAVEGQREKVSNPLLKKTLKYVIDGYEPQAVREIIEAEIDHALEEEEAAAKVYESAGGFAPTIGIIGAVLGLIHVMSQLDDPSKIGSGIAVAFVATVYGVGIANLFLIPAGSKLKRKAAIRALSKEIVKIGVTGIQEGLNPHFLREKLEVYIEERLRKTSTGAQKSGA